jgi:hypothetical protein
MIAADLALRMFQRGPGSNGEVAARVEMARSVAYWGRLNPSLSIGGGGCGAGLEARPLGARRREGAANQLLGDGYFQVDRLFSVAALRRMREAVEVLRRGDWPLVFAFVYDEFWLLPRVPSLVRLLSAALGAGYRQFADFWTFRVAGTPGAAGFAPHADDPSLADPRSRLAVWVPLSSATLDNGCIYVAPRRRVAPEPLARYFRDEGFRPADAAALLQASRALPARPGSVLGWDYGLLHWGSACGAAPEPRVSIGFGFLAEGSPPRSAELPLLDPHGPLPTFPQRLRMIARTIPKYQQREPSVVPYLGLAERLLEVMGEWEALPIAGPV